MRRSVLAVMCTLTLPLVAACDGEEASTGGESLALGTSPLVGKFVHAPTSVAPPPGTVRSALLELDFTTERDKAGHLVFHEKERSDDVHGSVLKKTGFYTATATTFTLHLSEDLSYDYHYRLASEGLVYWSADDGDRKEFLERQ